MSSSFRVSPFPRSEEIDFIQLVKIIWQHKKLVAAIIVAAGLIALACAFLITPTYEVGSVLRPAAINELDALNRSEVYKLPPGEALIKVGASLESYETRLGFFRENPGLFKEFEAPGRTLEQSFEEFNRNSISLILPDSRKTGSLSAYIRLEMTYPEGIDGVAILNGFVNYAIDTEREQIASDMRVIIKNRLTEIAGKLDAARANYEIDKEAKIASLNELDNLHRAQLQDERKALRAQLKTLRSDRVAQLDEAIGIAKSLGIRKPSTPSLLGDSERSLSNNIMRTEINNQQIPLYFMGVEALEAERNALMKRKSDDFTEGRIAQIARELQLLQANREIEVLKSREKEDLFLAGVQPLRTEEARLRNLSIDMAGVKLVTIDKPAQEPLGPFKPKRLLIVVIGLILGLIVGCASTLIWAFVRNGQSFYRALPISSRGAGATLPDGEPFCIS